MNEATKENILGIIGKMRLIDEVIDRLNSGDEKSKKARSGLIKKFTDRKVLLAEEIYPLLSNLTI